MTDNLKPVPSKNSGQALSSAEGSKIENLKWKTIPPNVLARADRVIR